MEGCNYSGGNFTFQRKRVTIYALVKGKQMRLITFLFLDSLICFGFLSPFKARFIFSGEKKRKLKAARHLQVVMNTWASTLKVDTPERRRC